MTTTPYILEQEQVRLHHVRQLSIIEEKLNQKFEQEVRYLSWDEKREWGSIIIGFNPSSPISKDEEKTLIRIMKKFTWYNVFPVNFKDGLWATF